jgi:hypothetical protein
MGWREVLKVHPACELFPMMTEPGLRELGEDIKKNRLQERAKLMRQGGDFVLIDGRSRLDAIEAVGLPIQVFIDSKPNRNFFEVVEVGNPIAFVISANIHRRHLSGEDRKRLITELIKLDPTKSNRQLAKEAGVTHPTIAKARESFEHSGGVEGAFHVDTKGRKQPARKSRAGASPSNAELSAAECKQHYAADDEARAPAWLMPRTGAALSMTDKTVMAVTSAIDALCDAIGRRAPAQVVAGVDPAALFKLARDAEIGSAWLAALHTLATAAAKGNSNHPAGNGGDAPLRQLELFSHEGGASTP